MKLQKFKAKSQIVLLAILVGAVLILANALAGRAFFRLDLTSDREYTLSDSTKKILKKLDDRVTVKLFFTRKVPPGLMPLQNRVTDLLEEYQNYSGGKVALQWVAPDESKANEDEATTMGVPPLQLNVREADKQEVRKVYMGLALLYGDKKQVIPVAADPQHLEYNLTSSLIRLTSPKVPVLGLIIPAEDQPTGLGFQSLEAALRQQMDVKKFGFGSTGITLENIDAALVVAPKKVSSGFIAELDVLIAKSIPVILLAGRVEVAPDLTAQVYDTGLEDWLQKKGIVLTPELIIDPNNPGRAAFSSGPVQYLIPYPFFVRVAREGLNGSHPVTASLESLILPWTNGISFSQESHPEFKFENLLKSSPQSFLQEGPPRLDPQALESLAIQPGAKHILGLSLEMPGAQKPSRLVLVSNANFIKDGFLNDTPQNILLVQNLADWVSWGDDLISIRSRGKTERPLEKLSAEEMSFIRWTHVIGLPLLFFAVAFGAWMKRKKRHQKVAEKLNS